MIRQPCSYKNAFLLSTEQILSWVSPETHQSRCPPQRRSHTDRDSVIWQSRPALNVKELARNAWATGTSSLCYSETRMLAPSDELRLLRLDPELKERMQDSIPLLHLICSFIDQAKSLLRLPRYPQPCRPLIWTNSGCISSSITSPLTPGPADAHLKILRRPLCVDSTKIRL